MFLVGFSLKENVIKVVFHSQIKILSREIKISTLFSMFSCPIEDIKENQMQ